jgi:ATP-dependent Clp protease ATP-binding subunit ClpC
MFERFTDRARRVVVLAQEEARMLDHNYTGTEHILLGLLHEGEGVAARALESLGISLEAVRQQVEEIIGQGQQAPSGHIPFTPRGKKALELSLREALQLGHNFIGTEHILLGLVRLDDGVAKQILVKLGTDLNRVRQQVIELLKALGAEYEAASFASTLLATERAKTSPARTAASSGPIESPPPTSLVLDQSGRQLTQAAREGKLDPVIGREKEIQRVVQILVRRTLSNPLLLGEPGVGKTAVVGGLAQKIVKGEVPAALAGKLVYGIDMGTLADSASGDDDLSARVRVILKEVRNRGDVILFLDGLRVLTIDLWAILKPMVSRGELQIIGAMTPAEYDVLLAEHPALQRSLVPVQVAEPTVAHTVEMLKGLRDRYEAHHGVSINDAALVAAAELADRRLQGRRLPAKAVDLMDEAASLVRMRKDAEPPHLRQYDEEIAQVRSEKESAIDFRDFEKAAAIRDTEKQLLARKAAGEAEWAARAISVQVDEEVIAETLSIMLGLSSDAAVDAPEVPPFAPAAMTDDDREIWAMS